MTETPEKSPSEPPERPDRHERDDSADTERDTIALPSHIAGSGTLDRLVETARDYARQAASPEDHRGSVNPVSSSATRKPVAQAAPNTRARLAARPACCASTSTQPPMKAQIAYGR